MSFLTQEVIFGGKKRLPAARFVRLLSGFPDSNNKHTQPTANGLQSLISTGP